MKNNAFLQKSVVMLQNLRKYNGSIIFRQKSIVFHKLFYIFGMFGTPPDPALTNSQTTDQLKNAEDAENV